MSIEMHLKSSYYRPVYKYKRQNVYVFNIMHATKHNNL